MNQREIVQALLDSVQRGDFEKAKSLLSSDYQFSGPIPEPINAETWLGITKNLKKAFPDLDYRFHVDGVEGEITKVSAELKGTHRGTLDLSPIGLGVTPATNKSFATPREHGTVTCKGDKVVSWVVDPIEGGGLMGILNQLGITVPTM
jgi:SnoaL-like polyketide cyclase